MGVETVLLAAGLALAAGTTAYGIASAPSAPKPPPPPKPLPPAPARAAPPPLAPSETDIGKGVAGQRAVRQKRFGLEETLLASQPRLGSQTGSIPKLGRPGA